MRAHKFKAITGQSVYSTIIFCEACGTVAYDSNRTDNSTKLQEDLLNGKKPCPYGKESETNQKKS